MVISSVLVSFSIKCCKHAFSTEFHGHKNLLWRSHYGYITLEACHTELAHRQLKLSSPSENMCPCLLKPMHVQEPLGSNKVYFHNSESSCPGSNAFWDPHPPKGLMFLLVPGILQGLMFWGLCFCWFLAYYKVFHPM